jgi:hypothetical protein
MSAGDCLFISGATGLDADAERGAGKLALHLQNTMAQQHAPSIAAAANALMDFCAKQPHGQDWQIAAARAGLIPLLLQLSGSKNSSLQLQALAHLERAVAGNAQNQVAADAAGALPLLLQLLVDTTVPLLQRQAASCLGGLCVGNSHCKSAAGVAAVSALLHTARLQNDDRVLQVAVICSLKTLVADHPDNQGVAGALDAVSLMVEVFDGSDDTLHRHAVECLGALVKGHSGFWFRFMVQGLGLGYNSSKYTDNQTAAGQAIWLMLSTLVEARDPSLKKEALIALSHLWSGHSQNKSTAGAGAVANLVQCLHHDDDLLHKEAVAALSSLVAGHLGNRIACAAHGAVPRLLQFAKCSDADLAKRATLALHYLVSVHADDIQDAATKGVVPLLLEVIGSSNAAMQKEAMLALGHILPGHNDIKNTAGTAGAALLLLSVAKSKHAALQREAVALLGKLVCGHPRNKSDAAGAILFLVQSLKSSDAVLQREAVVSLGEWSTSHDTQRTSHLTPHTRLRLSCGWSCFLPNCCC